MHSQDVIELLCCVGVLCLISVNSQSGCGVGWYGSYCQYKCQCTSKNCDKNGECAGKSRCIHGWFGPACQYANIAFQCSKVVELTDDEDSTCVTSADKAISVTLNGTYMFTWLRIVVSKPEAIGDIKVSFDNNGNTSQCTDMTYTFVGTSSTDIHCNVSNPIEIVILSGDGVRFLCSLYVSGGRNLALREKTEQSSTLSEKSDATFQLNITFTSTKAVDGKDSQVFYDGLSCSMTQESPMKKEFWMLTFPSTRLINRYVIYGRTDTTDLALLVCNISVESCDEQGNAVFFQADTPTDELPYSITFLHTPRPVHRVNIYSNYLPRSLVLCEVEVYGDSYCQPGRYGPDCQLTCQCPDNATCVVTSGACPTVTPVTATSTSQNTSCQPEFYGPKCALKCSGFCAKNKGGNRSCQGPNGTCDEGCMRGYTEPTCTERCAPGTYGDECKEICDPNCLEGRDPTVYPCHHASGVCLLGCKTGLSGPMCTTNTQPSVRSEGNDESSSYSGIFIALFVCLLLFLPALFCLRKKQSGTAHVETADISPPAPDTIGSNAPGQGQQTEVVAP